MQGPGRLGTAGRVEGRMVGLMGERAAPAERRARPHARPTHPNGATQSEPCAEQPTGTADVYGGRRGRGLVGEGGDGMRKHF